VFFLKFQVMIAAATPPKLILSINEIYNLTEEEIFVNKMQVRNSPKGLHFITAHHFP
jgi:hypothetical protein